MLLRCGSAWRTGDIQGSSPSWTPLVTTFKLKSQNLLLKCEKEPYPGMMNQAPQNKRSIFHAPAQNCCGREQCFPSPFTFLMGPLQLGWAAWPLAGGSWEAAMLLPASLAIPSVVTRLCVDSGGILRQGPEVPLEGCQPHWTGMAASKTFISRSHWGVGCLYSS